MLLQYWKKTTLNHAIYIQSVIDNLAHYWDKRPGNELGSRRDEQFPTLEILF